MSLLFNGVEPDSVKYNNNDVDRILFNNTNVWEREEIITQLVNVDLSTIVTDNNTWNALFCLPVKNKPNLICVLPAERILTNNVKACLINLEDFTTQILPITLDGNLTSVLLTASETSHQNSNNFQYLTSRLGTGTYSNKQAALWVDDVENNTVIVKANAYTQTPTGLSSMGNIDFYSGYTFGSDDTTHYKFDGSDFDVAFEITNDIVGISGENAGKLFYSTTDKIYFLGGGHLSASTTTISQGNYLLTYDKSTKTKEQKNNLLPTGISSDNNPNYYTTSYGYSRFGKVQTGNKIYAPLYGDARRDSNTKGKYNIGFMTYDINNDLASLKMCSSIEQIDNTDLPTSGYYRRCEMCKTGDKIVVANILRNTSTYDATSKYAVALAIIK